MNRNSALRLLPRLLAAALAGTALAASAQVTIPNTFTAGTTISASQVNANFTALKNAADATNTAVATANTNIAALQSTVMALQTTNYTMFGNLNFASVNVTTATQAAYTKLNVGTLTFNKARADTKIEVFVNSRFGAGTFGGAPGAPGIIFQARVDDAVANVAQTQGAITTSGATDFLSFIAVYSGLAAGSHTVSLWATTYIAGSSSTGVLTDPGGFFGSIVVRETF